MKIFLIARTPVFLIYILLCTSARTNGQSISLERQLVESRYLQTVMKPDSADMGITRWMKKEGRRTYDLTLVDSFRMLKLAGRGLLRLDTQNIISGKRCVVIETPASLDKKNPSNRSYGFAELIRPLNNENLEKYNRFSVWVYADAPGFNSVFAGCTLYNKGKHIMPTPGRFEGQHYVTVYPGKWQRIVWEIPDLYRDSVSGVSVSVMLGGSPKDAADTIRLYVKDMRIDSVETENTRGFTLRRNAIAFCHSGYRANDRKQALVQNVTSADFMLLDSGNRIAFSGKGKQLKNGYVLMDFSQFNHPGYYKIKIHGITTRLFPIGTDAWLATAWHTLNFFFAERCGYDQPGIHQICHLDAFSVHPDGRKVPVSGGWHDAADLTQGVGNTARAGMAMLELAASVKEKSPRLYERLLEEARWGLDWTLQTRFGDGYREGGLIMGIWSDNTVGTKDDMTGKATNNPSDNFISAAFCAVAEPLYKDDAAYSYLLRKVAVADFGFAMAGFDSAVTTKNETELCAQATVAAMNLYRLTKSESYLIIAGKMARRVMACQQTDRRKDWIIPLHGFFYESHEKKRILNFFHRSDEQLMVEGLTMLLKDAPDNKDAALWKTSCRAYADYLKEISGVIEPYAVLPAGVYEYNNADFSGIYHEGDAVGMPSMEEYNAQVKNGISLGHNFYLRRFPVAYQFRGFHAVTMGKAKAALLLAEALKDSSLRNIGVRQLEYIVGYNPFAMSTIYGDGYDYPTLYGGFAGDVVGAVPVGIETFENDDAPYMPMQVNATYKEIWTHSTASVMWLLAKILTDQ